MFTGNKKWTYEKKWSYADLERLPYEEYLKLLEEGIPSDTESDIGDCSDDELLTNENAAQELSELCELSNNTQIEIIFEDDTSVIQNNAVPETEDAEDYDTDDEIPLDVLKRRLFKEKPIWTTDATNLVQNKKEFAEDCGPNIPDTSETPTDIFLCLFPKELIDHIVFHTNLYATQISNGKPYTPTNHDEIKTFLGIHLIMGIKKLPSLRDYWSSRPELRDMYVSSCMPRDRFIWLLRHLHLNDNSLQPKKNAPNFDKLYKVRPLLNTLSATFASAYKPSKNQAIDESMIRFKGRSAIKQYMPLKPIKRGYKVWMRCDESGYCNQFQIYTGRIGDLAEKELGARVVKDLTRDLVGKGHHLYFDNYFNSVGLQQSLLEDFIYACGTARKGRKNVPTDLKDDKELQRGESDWKISKDGIVCMKWKDRKGILFLSNYQTPVATETVMRRAKDGTQEEVVCPKLVKNYNSYMGFVDKMDMLKSLYEIDRKSVKWWHRIFWHFLDLCVVNSFIIFYERVGAKSLALKSFRLAVALGLIGADPDMPKRGRKRTSEGTAIVSNYKPTVALEVRFDKCSHMPVHAKPRRCAQCSTKKEPHKSSWSCTICNVGLCLNDKKNCFILYHRK